MTNLSSAELFHFTKYQNLKMILESMCFYPRYNLEFTHLSDRYLRRAAFAPIPMVCFCDIPIGLSDHHRKRYGNCGIALSETWKLNNKLNPILYIQFESLLANAISDLNNSMEDFIPFINDYSQDKRVYEIFPRIADNLRYISYFLKQIENKTEKKIEYEGKIRVFEKRKFYDEKEWRFIPFEADASEELFITIWDFDNKEKLDKAHERMKKYPLSFKISDIDCIIVQNEEEKKEIVDIINLDEDLLGFEVLINKS